FVLPLSHDEVVHGKGSLINQMPGDDWQKFANLRLLFGYQYTSPGKPLLFMGGEFAQRSEWNHDEQLQWDLLKYPAHDGLKRYVGDLNRLTRQEPALFELDFEQAGYQWIHADDASNSVYSWRRHGRADNEVLIIVMNMTPVVRSGYRIGVPAAGHYTEILNSDAKIYGGTNVGNAGAGQTQPIPMHGQQQSLNLTLPPLGILVLKLGGTPVQGP
ncbi:MAG: alpha amylase C-terminal domain-containing protein, partial [Planctomycetaceae bacterium]|nr:alpha amylase C-terminal domain-containing protein [Planctomycetaceae bacterium]